jgi:1-phosphatidylinositol phosphodiesterase
MSKIADKTPVSQLTIPGTHDSATFNYSGVLSEYVVTQDLDLKTQLEYGVRFLDIRARVIENVLAIHHGSFFLKMYFGDVLDKCRKFLEENPSETIFMSVKKDHDDKDSSWSFQEAFLNRYYNSSEYKDLWYHMAIGKTFPTMGEMRGKIVLMSRSGLDSSLGIDFHIGDNKTGSLDVNQYLKLYYEDLYEPGADDDKVRAVSSHLKDAQSYLKSKNDALWVTFTSANKPVLLKGPWYYAKDQGGPKINEKLMKNMNILNSNSPMGIVPMDFQDWKLIRFLVDTNFKY